MMMMRETESSEVGPKGLCYFCGGPATTMEHAPPKQMFRAFECDSITVPSCDEHNTRRSASDQAIVSADIRNIEDSAGGSIRCMLAEIHLPFARSTD